MSVNLEDPLCLKLAVFLTEFINNKFQECYGSIYPNVRAVNGYEHYNKVNTQLDHFPLLRVYRLTDTHNKGIRFHSTTEVRIDYCCAYADVDHLPGLLSFISKALAEGIGNYAFSNQNVMPTREDKMPIQISYQIAANEYINQAHPYLTTTISVNDICDEDC